MQKNISGPAPLTAIDFAFDVTGNSVNQHLTISDLGTGFYSSPLTLSEGTYTITEVGPFGSDLAEWTVLWAGECDGVTEFTASFVVNSGNMGDGDQYCTAENQYRPGVLRVEKRFVGTSTAPENFSFKVTQGAVTKFEGPFESDGDNSVNIGKGAYSVVEKVSGAYTPSYSEGCSGTIANSQNVTCTITNTYTPAPYSQSSYYSQASYSEYSQSSYSQYSQSAYTPYSQGAYSYSQGSYGGGNGPSYLVYGYVWHDENESDIWEKDQPNPDDNEVDLDGWTVNITNGSTTYSTTTDLTGYYYFYVPVGTWTINEVVQDGWTKTFPNVNGHVVVVGETTQFENTNFFATVLDFLLPTVFAQSPTTYGPYDFGNVQSNSYSQGSYGGGGHHYSQGSYGGGSNNDDDDDDSDGSGNRPTPQVLGDATNVMPLGAANTGAGGTAGFSLNFHGIVAILTARKGVQVINGK